MKQETQVLVMKSIFRLNVAAIA